MIVTKFVILSNHQSFSLSFILIMKHFFEIAKQINLLTFSTDKLNLRLIRIFEYIQRFFLIIRHKSKRFYVIFDVLSRLFISKKSLSSTDFSHNDDELDMLFIVSMIEINSDFKTKIIESYQKNSVYVKI